MWPFSSRKKPVDLRAIRDQILAVSDEVEDWVAPKWRDFLIQKNNFDGEMPLETMMAAFFGINYENIKKAFPILKDAPIEVVVAVGGQGVSKSGTHPLDDVQAAMASLIAPEPRK